MTDAKPQPTVIATANVAPCGHSYSRRSHKTIALPEVGPDCHQTIACCLECGVITVYYSWTRGGLGDAVCRGPMPSKLELSTIDPDTDYTIVPSRARK